MKETLQIPTPETLEALIGKELYDIWTSLCQLIEQKYNMEQLWNHGGKKWIYEYKYRKGGKTLCEGYRNDECKAIHIIADAVVLPDMTAYTLLFQNAILEYSQADARRRFLPNLLPCKGCRSRLS